MSPLETKPVEEEKLVGLRFSLPLTEGKPALIEKWLSTMPREKTGSILMRSETGLALLKNIKLGFEEALEGHCRQWANTWDTVDIAIEGDRKFNKAYVFVSLTCIRHTTVRIML